MNVAGTDELVSGGSETIELKRTEGQRTGGARTVRGMPNGAGGFVHSGVEDDGRVVGIRFHGLG